MYISRRISPLVKHSLDKNAATAIIGPRQCGKSTLAKKILSEYNNTVYLDLERPSDLNKLENGEWYLSSHKDKLICIDEVQRKPELFPLLRSLVDEWQGKGHFLILGSSSRDLLKQSSESLAGRISYKRLSPFIFSELAPNISLEEYMVKGGFPSSVLETDDTDSYNWRSDFITTFLERDLLQWSGFQVTTMRRLWQMLAHTNGQTINYSAFANSLGITSATVKNYIDLLEGTFMLYVLQPYFTNQKKRIVKSPKVYISDSGLTLNLLGLKTFDDLLSHPVYGAVWEQIVLTHLITFFPEAIFSHYRSPDGAEIDIIMEYRSKIYAIECKAGKSPQLSKGFYFAKEFVKPLQCYVVAPVDEEWSIASDIHVINLEGIEKIGGENDRNSV